MSEARLSFAALAAGLPTAVAVAALAGGCGTVSNPEPMRQPATLASLQVSDAVMGQMGLARISFSNPVPEDTTITLTATPSSVITIAGSASILAEGISVDVPYTGVAPGTAQITATSGSASQTQAIEVVASLVLEEPYVDAMEVGAITETDAEVNIRVPAPLTVMLTSSNTSIATVDASVTIPQFQEYAETQVTAVAQGSATMMASAGGYEATYPFTVVAQASLDELEIPTSPPNTTVYAYAYLNAIPRAGGSVTLSSSDPSTAMVPASVPTNGNTYVPFNLTTGATSGTATVTATYNDASITEITYVTNASTSSFPDLCNFFINGDSTIEVGAAVLLYSEMCSASTTQSATGQIMFSTGGVVSTPTMTVEFPPATCDGCDIEISFPITGAANGTTNITMAANGQSDQVTITVKTPVFTMSGPTITIDEDETTNLGIDSDTLLATDRTFTLSSSAPSIVQVSSVSVTAGAGSTSTFFGIKGVAPGTSTITATNGSTVLTTTVTVE